MRAASHGVAREEGNNSMAGIALHIRAQRDGGNARVCWRWQRRCIASLRAYTRCQHVRSSRACAPASLQPRGQAVLA